MTDRKLIPGKFVWFQLESKDTKKAQAFYGEVLGWNAVPFPVGGSTYEMIFTGATADTMIGSYAAPRSDRQPSRWISSVSVEDVDAAAKAATASGGKVVEAPFDIPGVTSDPTKALAFYEKVLAFSHRSMDMGPNGTYHIVSKGGVDRGGVTSYLPAGVQPHWLPYVFVEDVDATVARARRIGGSIPFGPEDIPGVGRFGVLQDPTGAVLAVMKPSPTEKQR